MTDPFDSLSFEEEINPQRWASETRLHTPTFEALLKADGTLWLSGPALAEGFSVADVQVLTRFLSERVQLPPQDLPDAVQAWPRAKPTVEQYQAEHPLIDEQLCVTCGKPVTNFTVCYRCGKPLHMDNDGACGSWILDSWHPEAATENSFWCTACLKEEQEEPEQANKPRTVRYVEIRLPRPKWRWLDDLRELLPTLQEEDEITEDAETHQLVKGLRVRYDALSQEAIKFINDLQINYEFRDQLVPTAIDEED
jgi:hypothetical protein